jgi:hypothetical protein
MRLAKWLTARGKELSRRRPAGEGRQRSKIVFEPSSRARVLPTSGNRQEARMNHWNDTMVDRPDPNGPAYLAGWTISGIAVIGTILAVWLLGF